MKNAGLLLLFLYCAFNLQAQVDKTTSYIFEDGYTIRELENIFREVDFKNHKKWLKKAGFTYNEAKSKTNYYYYDKNEVVSLVLFYHDKTITEIAFHSSPQKYYQAADLLENDKSYRLVKQEIDDIGKGKFVKSSVYSKNGLVYFANTDRYNIHLHKDNENYSSMPVIKSLEEQTPLTLAIDDIRTRLNRVGPVYPETGSLYTGNEKLTQAIKAIDDKGTIQVEKKRVPKNNICKSASSFDVHEIITLNLKDVYYQLIKVYEGKNKQSTYVLCLGIKDWDKKGQRTYEMLGSNSSDNSCFYSGRWDNSATVNTYMTPYVNCAVSFEFTNPEDANQMKTLVEKAIAEAKK